MSKVKTLLEANWTGRTLSETVICAGERFKIVAGLQNGGGENRVYILGNDGWAYFLNRSDISTESYDNDASYVSDEDERKQYAEQLNSAFKVAISKIF